MSRSAPRWRHPYDFRATRPLFVDAWPAAWAALTPPHTLVGLDRAETQALGANTLGCQALFGDASPVPLAGLLARLDAAVARQGGDSSSG